MSFGTHKRKPLSEETKRKIGLANSISLKGRKLSVEMVEKIRDRMKKDNPMWKREAREKVSKKLKGIIRPRGKLNPNWKGNNITYFHFHKWLNDSFGKAIKCENKDCNRKSKNFEWSLIKGKKLQRKRENFWQLCKSCHRKYDFTEKQRQKMILSHLGKTPWNKGISQKQYLISKAEELKCQAEKI